MIRKVVLFVFAVGLSMGISNISWADASSNAGYQWTGVYVGVNGGYARALQDAQTTTVFSPTGYFAQTSPAAVARAGEQRFENNGLTGGIQAGYNKQFGGFVIGGEMDFNYLGIDNKKSCVEGYPCCAPTTLTVESSVQTDWIFTARPRVGYAINNILFYATGGLAVARIKADFRFMDNFATAFESASLSETKVGWTAGAGIEMGIIKNLSIKTEYLYSSFGSVSTDSNNLSAFNPRIAFPTNTFNHSVDLRTHIMRVGLNYRF